MRKSECYAIELEMIAWFSGFHMLIQNLKRATFFFRLRAYLIVHLSPFYDSSWLNNAFIKQMR